MAKKTKKEKILAEYHRKLQALNMSGVKAQGVEYKLPVEEKPIQKVVNYPVPTMNPVYHEHQTDYSYVLSDLRRIALLAALAICAQLVLWYRLGR